MAIGALRDATTRDDADAAEQIFAAARKVARDAAAVPAGLGGAWLAAQCSLQALLGRRLAGCLGYRTGLAAEGSPTDRAGAPGGNDLSEKLALVPKVEKPSAAALKRKPAADDQIEGIL